MRHISALAAGLKPAPLAEAAPLAPVPDAGAMSSCVSTHTCADWLAAGDGGDPLRVSLPRIACVPSPTLLTLGRPLGSAWAPWPALETAGREGALTRDPALEDGRLLLSAPVFAAVPSQERSRLALSLSLTHIYI